MMNNQELLKACLEKIELYRDAVKSEYLGGMPNQILLPALREAIRAPRPEEGSFWPIGFINNDGGITYEPGREPRPEQGGKLIYIARQSAAWSESSKEGK